MVNSADLESSKRRGIKAKKFEAHLDSRTSRICRKHNQIVIPIDKIKIGENAPPLHPYCRSFLSDLLEDWDYETEEELEALISDEYKDKAKRIDVRELSAPYNEILAVKDKKDINEFEQFKQVLENSPNMPKSLGEFLDLKYNNIKEWLTLNREIKTIKNIILNSSNTERDIKAYYDFRKYGMEMTDHSIESYFNRMFKKNGEQNYTMEDVIEVFESEINGYDTETNRNVRYYNSIAILTEIDTEEIISFRKGRSKKSWNIH